MNETWLVYALTLAVGVMYAAVVAWARWASEDGSLPPFSVTFGVGLAWAAFTWLRGWEEGLYLLLVLALMGGPQIVAWQVDWLLRSRDGRRELR